MARMKKIDHVLARMRAIAKERGVRVMFGCKDTPEGSMQTDGEHIFIARICTFPSAEALAISFCHELAHIAMWKETKSRVCRCGFQEEIWAWAIGIDYYYGLFKGVGLKKFSLTNLKMNKYVVSRIATYAGMFNLRFEGFLAHDCRKHVYAIKCGGEIVRVKTAPAQECEGVE